MATALAITQRRVAPDGRELGLAVDEGKKKLFLIVPVQRDKVRLAVLRRLRELTPMEQAAGLEGFFTITGVEQVGEELLLAINFDQALWDSWSEQRDRRITPEETVLLLNRCLQLLLACRQQGIPWFGFHPTDVVWSASAGPVLLDPRLGLILDDVMPAEPRRDFCLPPEVLQGQAWTESSALYTIGLTVYTLLGGIFPYQTGDASDAAESVLREEPLDIRYAAPETGAALARLLAALLKKAPAERPTLEQVREKLAEVMRQGAVADEDQRRSFAARAVRAVEKRKGLRAVRKYWRHRKTVWLVAFVVVFLVYFYTRPLSAPVLTPATTPDQVVALYYQALDEADAVTLNQLVVRGAAGKMIDMATLARVLSDFNPLGPREVMRIKGLEIKKLRETPEEAVYTAGYRREVVTPRELQEDWCADRLVLRPVNKIWRIVQYESKVLKTEVIEVKSPTEDGVDNP